jgi:hypothetical protein
MFFTHSFFFSRMGFLLLHFLFSIIPKTSYKAVVLINRFIGHHLWPSGIGCKVLEKEISTVGICFLAFLSRVLELKFGQNYRARTGISPWRVELEHKIKARVKLELKLDLDSTKNQMSRARASITR